MNLGLVVPLRVRGSFLPYSAGFINSYIFRNIPKIMGVFNRAEGKKSTSEWQLHKGNISYCGRPNQRPTSPWPLCDLLPLLHPPLPLKNPIKKCRTAPLSSPKTNKQKTQTTRAAPTSIDTYLKEEITPGGIHPEKGPKPNQTGSKEGREEGSGAEEEALQLLLGKQNLRPVSQLFSACPAQLMSI